MNIQYLNILVLTRYIETPSSHTIPELPPESNLERTTLHLTVNDVPVELSTVSRGGHLSPILFLHGFGSTKEDYVDVALNESFAGRPFIAYDTPGSGESTCADLSKLSIPFFVSVAQAVIEYFGIDRYHLVGHSMGGLTGLLVAEQNQAAVPSFINIKGNLAPEDCFLSRQIFNFPASNTEEFVHRFVERTRQSPFYGNALYATSFKQKVRLGAVRPTFESMVDFSDTKPLLTTFETLPMAKMFMFGEQYASLTYLPRLARAGIELAEISHSGHFVMYSNAVAMWARISQFLAQVDSVPSL